MTSPLHHHLASQLIDIECALRNAGLWSTEAPSAESLASVEPFCVDTMGFDQWLQFVFLPRMRTLLDARGALPTACDIAAMGETVWTNNTAALPVIRALRDFDEMINDASQESLVN
jgi:uncharacterized protein YqcC (DUF446 family)